MEGEKILDKEESSAKIYMYNLPFVLCSCQNEKGVQTRIARNYKTFYDKFKAGGRSQDVADEMGLMRMCCRRRFINPPIDFMIDRSKERFFDNRDKDIISFGTRELEPGISPPDFPLLPK
jgi:DNA-directed RNA polymerase subunit N (RpoN/RPB10)